MADKKRDEHNASDTLWLALKVVGASVVVFFIGFFLMYTVLDVFNRGLGKGTAPALQEDTAEQPASTPKSTPKAAPQDSMEKQTPEPEQGTASLSTPDALSSAKEDNSAADSSGSPPDSPALSNSISGSSASASSAPGSSASGESAPGNSPSGAVEPATSPGPTSLLKVRIGRYQDRDKAESALASIRQEEPGAFIVHENEYQIQVGAFTDVRGAETVADKYRKKGFVIEIISL